jgi:hypothetical protein
MIMLHHRAIPDLRRQVQQAIAASARATRQPPAARRPLPGSSCPSHSGSLTSAAAPDGCSARHASTTR